MKHLFNLEIPIIQAPMAGGITTPELVAAVSNTGALGSLGAGYMAPDEIHHAIRKIKSLTNKPFNINLFIPEPFHPTYDPSSINELLISFWRELSDTPFKSDDVQLFSFENQVQAILEEKVPIFSFTFGILSSSLIERFKSQGTRVVGTATTPEEARQLENVGVDAVVCQGHEAGGHRGTFSSYDPLYGLFTLLALTREKTRIPLIAAGGIMDGRSISAALFVGASSAQLGTAFLTTHESGAHPIYKKALLSTLQTPTALTKAFTGKPARALINSFMEKLEGCQIPPYPVQHFLTQRLRTLAARANRLDLMSLWAGQGYPLCRAISAPALIEQFVQELKIIHTY